MAKRSYPTSEVRDAWPDDTPMPKDRGRADIHPRSQVRVAPERSHPTPGVSGWRQKDNPHSRPRQLTGGATIHPRRKPGWWRPRGNYTMPKGQEGQKDALIQGMSSHKSDMSWDRAPTPRWYCSAKWWCCRGIRGDTLKPYHRNLVNPITLDYTLLQLMTLSYALVNISDGAVMVEDIGIRMSTIGMAPFSRVLPWDLILNNSKKGADICSRGASRSVEATHYKISGQAEFQKEWGGMAAAK